MFTISARTIRRPVGRNFPVEDPDVAEVVSDFETMLTNIMGEQPNARNHGFSRGPMMGMFPFPSETGPPGFDPFRAFPGGDQNARGAGRVPPGDDRDAQIPAGNIQE
jgi:hypothetical protein